MRTFPWGIQSNFSILIGNIQSSLTFVRSICENIYVCVRSCSFTRVHAAAISIRPEESSFFSTTSCTSCARSPFFTTEDLQTPHVHRTLSFVSTMKKHLRAAGVTLSLENIPYVARHVFSSGTCLYPHLSPSNFQRVQKCYMARFHLSFYVRI